ncbi:MAG: PKD domain-containing protein [Thermoanaerobaculia bacterium]
MTSSLWRASGRRTGRLFLTLAAVLGLSSGLAHEAFAQCLLQTGPTKLTCPGCRIPPQLSPGELFNASAGWLGLYRYSGGDRLLASMTWGAIVYNLASGAFPSEVAVYDLRDSPGGPGFPHQDGQSYGNGYGLSSDGQRMLYSLHIVAQTTTVSVPSGDSFTVQGATGPGDAVKGMAVQISGSRYIAYGLATSGNFFAADVTTLTGFNATNPIPYETPSLFGTYASNLGFAEHSGKQYLYDNDGTGVTVVDVSNPGPVGSITSGFVAKSIPISAFGLPSSPNLVGVSAAVDPAGNGIYVLGSFWSTTQVPSFGLVLFNPATSATTLIGTFTSPDPSFNSAAGLGAGTLAYNSYTNDVMAFMWVKSASQGKYRLYANSVGNFGSPISQTADITGPAGYLAGTSILYRSQTDTYAYFFDGYAPWAVQLSCQSGPSPAAGHLNVSNVSTGSPVSVSNGDTVFVGDTLTVTPSVNPSNAIQPVTAWNLDLDYHTLTETGSGSIAFMQLLYPDACLFGDCNNAFNSNPDPPPFTLVGPCDFRTGGLPATGANCWASVGPSPGNGDFTSAQPAAGTTATLPIAFEAKNVLNTTTVPLATFNVVWKVPTVKVQNLSAILNGNSATFTDGSEGHPVATGYKWYFGTDKTAPGTESLTPDPGCTGSTCNHIFGLGNGTYNAWLTVSYKNQYVSPDCSNPCGGVAPSFKVNVTDFVAAFTADATTYLGSTIHVTNQSQTGTSTGISYLYYLCPVSSGSCPDVATGSYSPLSFSGSSATIPAPATAGPWWLRIKATYNTSETAQWLPNAVSDVTAWPVTVSAVPPQIYPISGASTCTFQGCPQPYTGSTGTAITVALYQGNTRLTGPYTWSVTGANTFSGSGSTFTFTPQNPGTTTVAVTSGTSPLPGSIGISIANSAPPPASLSVTVSANNYSPTTGVSISFTASPSGGSGSYSSYDWYFGDGNTAPGGSSSASHSYASSGSKTISCTVHDSAGATASGSTTIGVQAPAGPTNAIYPTSGASTCTFQGCPAPYSGSTGTAITMTAYQGSTPLTGTYSWTVTGVSASPSSGTGSTFSFTPTSSGTATVTNVTLSVSTTISISGASQPTTTIFPTQGATNCTAGCGSVQYTGQAGTPITVAAYQGSTLLTGSYSWTVTGTGVNPSPPSGTGNTFTFTPLGPGTATITNTTLSASVNIQISGTIQLPDFIVSDAVRGNITPGSDGSFLLVVGRATTFTAVAKGTTTPLTGDVGWNFGDGGTSTSNPASKTYSTPGAWSVTISYAGQIVTHAVFPVAGIPTGAYYSYYSDGGPFDPNHVDPNRTLLFQATEHYSATYSWNFNDGTAIAAGANVSHSFAALGSYTVVLTETLGANTFTTALPTTFVVSIAPRWIVPGLAFASGVLPGSFYVSDVVLENPNASLPMTLSLGLADGTAPASMTWKSLQLQPMESRTYSNILQSLFGKAAGGPATALIIKGDSLPGSSSPVIWASTYNNNGGDPSKGTFGVAIPAVPISGTISPASGGALTEFPGLRDVPDFSARSPLVSYPNVSPAYTNVGFVNAGDVAATLTLSFRSSRLDTLFNKLGSDVTLTVNPNETRQLTQVLTKSTPSGAGWDIIGHPADNYFMTVSVAGGGKVVPYTTVKDIGSSDSIFMTSDGTLSTIYRVPAVVRAQGQNGAIFRSRVVLFNPSGSQRVVQLALSFLKCTPGTSTCDPRQVVTGNLTLWSGQTVIYEDFVKEWLTAHDTIVHDELDYTTSFVDVSPSDLNSDPLIVRAETYSASATGNFGTQVPGFVASIHGASPTPGGNGARLVIPRALPNGGQTGFRTNVALVLLSGVSGTAKVRLYPDTGGDPLPYASGGTSDFWISLTAGEPFVQRSLEKIFPAISLFGTANKYSLEIVVTNGTIGAYASINDNVTNDSTVLVGRPQQ